MEEVEIDRYLEYYLQATSYPPLDYFMFNNIKNTKPHFSIMILSVCSLNSKSYKSMKNVADMSSIGRPLKNEIKKFVTSKNIYLVHSCQ